jgi:hypothetical protein
VECGKDCIFKTIILQMALPAKKKRGIRLLKHEDVNYYWKVREDTSNAMLAVIVGLEARPSLFFIVYVSFVNPSLYGPWLALAHEQGRDVSTINEPDKISPKLIVEAIAFANTQNWQEKKKFNVTYKDGTFRI